MIRMRQIRLPSSSVVDEGGEPRLQVQRETPAGGQEPVVVRDLPLQWDSRGYMCEVPAPALGNSWLRRVFRRPVEQVRRDAAGGRLRYERHRRERKDLALNMSGISGVAIAAAVGAISNLYKWSTCDEMQTGLAQKQCRVDGGLALAAVIFAGGAAIGSGMRAILALQSKVLDDSEKEAGRGPDGAAERPGDVEEGAAAAEVPERPVASGTGTVRKHRLPFDSIVRVNGAPRLEITRRTVVGQDEVLVLHDLPLKRDEQGYFCEIPKSTRWEALAALFRSPVSTIRGDVSMGQLQAARRRQESTDLALAMASVSGIAMSAGVGAIGNLYKWTTCGDMQGHMAQSQCKVDGWSGLAVVLFAGGAALCSGWRAVLAWQAKILDETERETAAAGGTGAGQQHGAAPAPAAGQAGAGLERDGAEIVPATPAAGRQGPREIELQRYPRVDPRAPMKEPVPATENQAWKKALRMPG